MANKLNELSCIVSIGNTGRPSCVDDPSEIIGCILTPYAKVYKSSEMGTSLEATLEAGSVLDAKGSRIFPIGRFENITAKGDDRVVQTSGYGNKRTIRDGKIGYEFEMWNGGSYYHQALRAFSGKEDQFRVIFVDKDNRLIGTVRDDADNRPGLAGFALTDLYVSKFNWANGGNGNNWTIDFELADAEEMNARLAIVHCDFAPLSEIVGLQNAVISNLTPLTGGAANHLILSVHANGVDLIDTYAVELAQTGAWKVLNATTGATLTVSAVTATSTGWNLTITSGTGVTATVQLHAPSVLAALTSPITGIESNILTVAIP